MWCSLSGEIPTGDLMFLSFIVVLREFILEHRGGGLLSEGHSLHSMRHYHDL